MEKHAFGMQNIYSTQLFIPSKSILISRLKPYKNQKNSNKPTKTHSISHNKRPLLSSFCTVSRPNGGATVHPQTQILPFYIIFSLSSHRWCCLSLSTICATNGLGLGLPIKVKVKQDQIKAERDQIEVWFVVWVDLGLIFGWFCWFVVDICWFVTVGGTGLPWVSGLLMDLLVC